MGNTSSTSSSKGTLTSAFLTSQHGSSFVSSLFSTSSASGEPVRELPDGTFLKLSNVCRLYQQYYDQYAATASRDDKKSRDLCYNYLVANFQRVLSQPNARRSIFELSQPALEWVIKADDLAIYSEFLLYLVAGVWADRQVTLEKGEEWEFPAADESAENEEEDAKTLASLPQGSDENQVDIETPDWKFDDEYVKKLRYKLAPFLPHIRFPYMSVEHLAAIEQEGHLVPQHYITEAYRHRALSGADFYVPDVNTNPRLKPRRSTVVPTWDPSWHGQHISVSSDGYTVKKEQSYWYSIAVAKEGYSTGRRTWAVQVNGDEAYVGVARKEINQMDNYLGVDNNSWAYFYSAQKYHSIQNSYGATFGRGDVVGVVLDMHAMTLSFYLNGKPLGVAFTNLPKVPLYPAVGWRDGTMKFVQSMGAAF